jgi:hypothetical protein
MKLWYTIAKSESVCCGGICDVQKEVMDIDLNDINPGKRIEPVNASK